MKSGSIILEARADEGENEDDRHRAAVGFQPAEVFAEVLASLAAAKLAPPGKRRLFGGFCSGLRRLPLLARFNGLVEPALLVVLDEAAVALAR